LGPNTAARGTDDSGALERRAYNENRLADNRGVGRGTGGATEMDAQVAVPVSVHAIEEAVRRIGAQRYDQRDGRDECDQTITAETRAQDGRVIWRWTNKPSLIGASGQPER
jgi:hypothetical protein